jgi:beta-glucanase (GH16 family)
MRAKIHFALAAAVLATFLTVVSADASPTLKGTSCPVKGLTVNYKGYKYTCVSVKVIVKKKAVKKLEWNAGVKIHSTTHGAPALPTQNFDTTPAGSLLWSETFNASAGTTPDSNVWTPVTGFGTYGTGEIENNTSDPTNVSTDGNGNLVITATCVATTAPGCTATSQPMGQTWTSARIWTSGKATFQYGQLEARIWMPTGSYNWPAFWMMGQAYTSGQTNTGWPYCGELDIAEGLQNNTQDQATIHSNIPGSATDWAEGNGLTQVAPISTAQMTGGYNNYGIVWAPNSITFILNGKAWARDVYDPTTKDVTQTVLHAGTQQSATFGPGKAISSIGGDWPFNNPFFIILNDAIGGITSPVAPNGSSATMKIQWVHYYKNGTYGHTTASTL